MEIAWVGFVGVIAGALVTGAIQVATVFVSRSTERRRDKRRERLAPYTTALWEVRSFLARFKLPFCLNTPRRATTRNLNRRTSANC